MIHNILRKMLWRRVSNRGLKGLLAKNFIRTFAGKEEQMIKKTRVDNQSLPIDMAEVYYFFYGSILFFFMHDFFHDIIQNLRYKIRT